MGEMEEGFDWMSFGRGEVGGVICSGLPIGALWVWQEGTMWALAGAAAPPQKTPSLNETGISHTAALAHT